MTSKPEIKERFAEAVNNSRLLRGLVNYSERVEGLFYMTGNLILMGKDSYAAGALEFSPNMLAGMLFLCSDASFALSKKRPWTRRISGVCITSAGSLVMFDGLKNPDGLTGFVLGTGMIILSGLQILLENQMTRLSTHLAEKKRTGLAGIFAKAAEKYTAYPLLVTAMPNFLQKPGMIISSLMRADIPFAVTSACWMVGDLGMGATDKLFKNMLKEPEQKAQKSTAPVVP